MDKVKVSPHVGIIVLLIKGLPSPKCFSEFNWDHCIKSICNAKWGLLVDDWGVQWYPHRISGISFSIGPLLVLIIFNSLRITLFTTFDWLFICGCSTDEAQ